MKWAFGVEELSNYTAIVPPRIERHWKEQGDTTTDWDGFFVGSLPTPWVYY
jgi:hypothetical protein